MKRIVCVIGLLVCFSISAAAGNFRMSSKKVSTWNFESDAIAFYKLEDNAASTTVIDWVSTNTGTAARNTSLFSAAGKIGGALQFNGTTDDIDGNSDFIGTGADSICAWIYPTGWGEGGYGRIVDNTKTIFFVSTTNGTLGAVSDGASWKYSATFSVILNTWQFVCITRTDTGVLNFYVNGVQNGTANQASGTPAGGTNVIIGNNAATDKTFAGKIDALMIFDRVLTPEEIKYLYNKGNGIEKLKWYYY